MTKILAIISTHGNELLGPNLLAYMLAKRSKLLENIEFIIANPRAYAKNVRDLVKRIQEYKGNGHLIIKNADAQTLILFTDSDQTETTLVVEMPLNVPQGESGL